MSHVNQFNLNALYGMVGLAVGWPLTLWLITRRWGRARAMRETGNK